MAGLHRPAGYEDLAKLLGEKVRSRREDLGITQEDLANSLGLERKSLQNIEYGRASARVGGGYGVSNPTFATIYALSVELGVSMSYLTDPELPVRRER